MNFDVEILAYMKRTIENILRELKYAYYTDHLLTLVNPNYISIVLYSKEWDLVEKHLNEHGFTQIKNAYNHNYNYFTLSYRNTVVIRVLKDKKTYCQMRDENEKIASIGLKNIVKELTDGGYSTSSMRNMLLKTAAYK
jgi:hypothetical protein